MPIKPNSRPQAPKDKVEAYAKKHCRKSIKLADYPCYMLAVRGYYLNTMGKKGANDRGIYDDAIMLVSPTLYYTVNANTDPGAFRKRIANLKVGTHLYKMGIHGISRPASQRYAAFRQAEKVTVVRDGVGEDLGYFGINIHKGGYNSVSSLGCQTVYPTQWLGFKEAFYTELKRYNQKVFPYILIDNDGGF